MSTAMHDPDGPEDQNTFWMRRVLTGLAALVALLLVWWIGSSLFGGSKSDQTVQADPQNASSLPSLDTGSPTPTPSATPSGSSTPSSTSSMDATATPSASGVLASDSATPSASASSTASDSSSASASASSSASSTPAATGSVECSVSNLSLAISGESSVKIGSSAPITLTFTNNGQQACFLDFSSLPVQVKVVSGVDLIWTSDHCDKWAPSGIVKIAAGKTSTWSTSWPTKRSASGCKLLSTKLNPGTYVARATFIQGGTPARLVMVAHN